MTFTTGAGAEVVAVEATGSTACRGAGAGSYPLATVVVNTFVSITGVPLTVDTTVEVVTFSTGSGEP
ncbi:hypothetical protein [Corynebacterium hindlerae]|uniref:hypothetical protein n=1 Tax=Corynebacterium hindlerae TaxID=699041 RepID=UPI003AAFE5E2